MENLRKEALWIAMSFPARHLNSHAVDPLQPTFKLQRPFLRFQRYGPIAHFNASLKVLTRLPGTGLAEFPFRNPDSPLSYLRSQVFGEAKPETWTTLLPASRRISGAFKTCYWSRKNERQNSVVAMALIG